MAADMTEEQAAQLLRNALLVAGHEMGPVGDHWPVIKSTVFDIMKGFEEMKIERNVDAELKIHLYEQLTEMERYVREELATDQAATLAKLKDLREIYDAYFSTPDKEAASIREDEIPTYIKRAKTIVATLEDGSE
jgi:hypothetical protein